MRIPDEEQLYKQGDNVMLEEGRPGTISNVLSHSVYYEARPIASYIQYTYVVTCERGDKHYLKAADILRLN